VTDAEGNPVTDYEANWTKEPDVTKPGKSTGTVKVTYPDGSKETVEVPVTVRDEKGQTQADKNTPKEPADKTPVGDKDNLTDSEKDAVKQAVENENKDGNGDSTLPGGTTIEVGNDGTTVITYPDGSKDTIPGDRLVETVVNVIFKGIDKKWDGKPAEVTVTITDKNGENVDITLEAGVDYVITKKSAVTSRLRMAIARQLTDAPSDVGSYHVTLTDAGRAKLEAAYDKVNETPGDFTISPMDKPELVTPDDKVKVDDPTKLTDGEKGEVKDAIKEANPDLPKGEDGKETEITVGDDGTATITYPDGTTDTIPGDKVVEGKTDADKNDPKEPGDKVKVDDPTKLTDDEKGEVVKAVEDANKDDNGNSTLPDGTKVTVGDNGDVTVTYPDGTTDTIPGDKVVEGKTDADKNDPKEPGDKVKVDDPTKLTDDEKEEVVKAVEDANKDDNGNSTLPDGTKVTVGDNGDVTVTYPDGSEDTIPGDKVVEGKTDAEKSEPVVPGNKVEVDNPGNLTDVEKGQVAENVEKSNPGTKVTVGNDGTATLTYPDGSTNTIPGSQLVTAKGNGNTTNSNVKVTPTNTNNKINKDNNSLGKNTANAKAGELPQTGETNDSQKLSVIGMALMGILGLFGLGKKRKTS
ncbi:LPXTG cell wall anchor domain-containing protein, partial [Lactobacillus salivarius]|nr:LPXTG cell wall anchor domain-containing protein [Ligilactobacillus salivarius]